MKKLFRLRSWLTLDEAVEHLSVLFGEQITRAELLRLALDGEFTLSVRFVNGVYAKGGKAIHSSEAHRISMPDLNGNTFEVFSGIFIDEARVIDTKPGVRFLTGVWDLPMIGAEQIDVEHEYQALTSGPVLDLFDLEGAFVCKDGEYWQLQEHFSNNKYFKASNLKAPWTDPENFYPAAGIPSDAVLVARPDSLRDLTGRVQAVENEVPPSAVNQPADLLTPPTEQQRSGGRRMSNLWPNWVAELVLHLHESGFPDGDGASGQAALIAAVEDKLAQRGREAPSRTTVQATARAVLFRYRESGN